MECQNARNTQKEAVKKHTGYVVEEGENDGNKRTKMKSSQATGDRILLIFLLFFGLVE